MVVINIEEEEDFLIRKTGICPIAIHDYIVGQNAFYEKKGILFYDDEEHELDLSGVHIDDDEKCVYISSITGLELDTCERISDAELEYMRILGVVETEDDPVEYDMLDRVIGRLNQRQRQEVLNVIRKMYDLK